MVCNSFCYRFKANIAGSGESQKLIRTLSQPRIIEKKQTNKEKSLLEKIKLKINNDIYRSQSTTHKQNKTNKPHFQEGMSH